MLWNHLATSGSLKKRLVFSVLLSLSEMLPVLALTMCLQHALNLAVVNGDLKMLIWDGVGIMAAAIATASIGFFNGKIALSVNKEISKKLYSQLIEKCLRMNPAFYQRGEISPLSSQIAQDLEKLHSMGVVFLIKFVPSLVVSLAIGFFLFWISPQLACVLMLATPVFIVSSFFLERKLKNSAKAHREEVGVFTGGIRFLFDMMDLIQSQGAEETESIRQHEKLDRTSERMSQFFWFNTLYDLCQNLIVAIATVVILVAGGAMVIYGSMPWGHLIAFYIAVGFLKRYAQSFVIAIPKLIDGKIALQKLNAFLNEPENTPYQGALREDLQGEVHVDNVSFGFSEKKLFQNVSFKVQKGQIVALLGPNGVGKSTLVNLIMGFHRPSQGAIYFDQRQMDLLDVKYLRKSIALVRQNPQVFPGTIRENILYGNAQEDGLQSAVDRAGLTPFVEGLPLKLETQVGVSGLYLSGGQRQKIALARALIRKPKILILDEPTNHLDAHSIEAVLESLKELKNEMAILLISHHAELAAIADTCYYI